jgi:hypothetical protein
MRILTNNNSVKLFIYLHAKLNSQGSVAVSTNTKRQQKQTRRQKTNKQITGLSQ